MDSKNKYAPLAAETAPTTPSTPPDLGSDSWESSKLSMQLAQPQKNENLEKEESRAKPSERSEKNKNPNKHDKNKSTKASDKLGLKAGQNRDKLTPKFSFRMFRMTGIFSSHNKVKKETGNRSNYISILGSHVA